MSRWKKILIGIVVFLFLFSLTGFFILPPVIKSVLSDKLSEALHRDVTIGKISLNPFNLKATIRGLVIKERGRSQPFVSFEELYVNAQGFSSLCKRALVIQEIRLLKPYVHIDRHTDGSYNFADLIPKESAKTEKKSIEFSLKNIQILNGSVDFNDQPLKTQHTARDINLSVPLVSDVNQDINAYEEPKFSATINGTPYALKGKTKPFLASRITSFDLDIRDIDLPYYLNYVPVKLNCKLKSALLDLKLSVHFMMAQSKLPVINVAGDLALKKVLLNDLQNRPVLKIPALNMSLASVEPFVPNIHVARISAQAPEILIEKSKAGKINLAGLAGSNEGKQSEKKKPQPATAAAPKGPGLQAVIDDFTIDAADFTFRDLQPESPVVLNLNPVHVGIKNIGIGKAKGGSVDLSLTVNKKGSISLKGPLDIDPLHAELDVNIKKIDIRMFQAYFSDRVKIDVTRGAVATAGRLAFDLDDKKAPRIKYTGQISISDLATEDRASSNRFVNWKQLYFENLSAGFNPFFVDIEGVSLTDFYARLIVNPDGVMNVQDIFSTNGKNEEKTGNGSPAPVAQTASQPGPQKTGPIKIGKITLQGGTVDFSDKLIQPNYSARMLNLGGSVTGLSSEEITKAAVDLKGNLGAGAPIEISGSINPLIKDLYADIKVRFKDIDLSPVTPYSSRYLGYPIVKGKLSFDVAYLIDKRKLDAKNKVFLDQLTFGSRVNSPDAVKAPVPLAVSLLSDRNGQINLDIPLSGSLDDPKFKVWPIIWKVIGNLITRAVTAPFSFLASLVGGSGEELSYIEFDYGSDSLADNNQQKIKSLAKALAQKPNLKIEIAGFTDPEKDKEGLGSAEFDRQIKVQKFKEAAKKAADKDEKTIKFSQISIEPQEYGKYLTAAYKAAPFPKARNVVGVVKELPPAEMEKLIRTHIETTDNDLRKLAASRTVKVKEQLLATGEIDSGRIFIVEAQSAPAKKEKVKESRVEFKIK